MDTETAEKGFFNGRFYKLVRIPNGETTLEIDGIRMHQTRSKMPKQDARDKATALGVGKGDVVLDVCTGLGYSAIACLQAGAERVVTIEKDESVLEIAGANAASKELFESRKIEIINGDAFTAIHELPDGEFDCVLHDPPRLAHAGELYSLEFYKELYRVVNEGGRLFHYTGTPGIKSGKNIPKGVKQRLSEAGFMNIRWVDDCLGFIAEK